MGGLLTKESDKDGNIKIPEFQGEVAFIKDLPTPSDFEQNFNAKYAPYNLKDDYDKFKISNDAQFKSLKDEYESNKLSELEKMNTLKTTVNENFDKIFSFINLQNK